LDSGLVFNINRRSALASGFGFRASAQAFELIDHGCAGRSGDSRRPVTQRPLPASSRKPISVNAVGASSSRGWEADVIIAESKFVECAERLIAGVCFPGLRMRGNVFFRAGKTYRTRTSQVAAWSAECSGQGPV